MWNRKDVVRTIAREWNRGGSFDIIRNTGTSNNNLRSLLSKHANVFVPVKVSLRKGIAVFVVVIIANKKVVRAALALNDFTVNASQIDRNTIDPGKCSSVLHVRAKEESLSTLEVDDNRVRRPADGIHFWL